MRDEVQQRLRTGESLEDLLPATKEGRLDLRGMPFTGDFTEVHGTGLTALDLTGASAANLRLLGCHVENCVFDRSDCRFWKPEESTIERCSFSQADLRHALLGIWRDRRGNTYRQVAFTAARMSRVSSNAATYIDCDFSHAELDHVNFWQSSLIRCRFAGPLRDVVFDGRHLGERKPDPNPMADVDLTDAVLHGCEFRGVRFDLVRLPADPALLLVADLDTVDRATTALPPTGTSPAATVAHLVLDQVRSSLAAGHADLVNLRDVGPAADLIRHALTAAGWSPGG